MSTEEWSQELTLAWWMDVCLVRVDLWRRRGTRMRRRTQIQCTSGCSLFCFFIPYIQVRRSNSPPFSWTRWERGRSGGKTGASRGGTWQSRSGETRDDVAAWTPTLQTAPGFLSGEIPPTGNTHLSCADSGAEEPQGCPRVTFRWKMFASVSRSIHIAFFLMDMTERPTSMQPWSFPFFSYKPKTLG